MVELSQGLSRQLLLSTSALWQPLRASSSRRGSACKAGLGFDGAATCPPPGSHSHAERQLLRPARTRRSRLTSQPTLISSTPPIQTRSCHDAQGTCGRGITAGARRRCRRQADGRGHRRPTRATGDLRGRLVAEKARSVSEGHLGRAFLTAQTRSADAEHVLQRQDSRSSQSRCAASIPADHSSGKSASRDTSAARALGVCPVPGRGTTMHNTIRDAQGAHKQKHLMVRQCAGSPALLW
jgi:hypothetical protein